MEAHEHGASRSGKAGGAASLRLRLTSSKAGSASDDIQRKLQGEVPAHLQPLIAGLLQHDDAVMKWLAEDDDRAAAFLLDPVGALRKSGISIDTGVLDTLGAAAAQARAKASPVDASRIRAVKVSAKPVQG